MRQQLYQYLVQELYPLPDCDTCQYSDISIKRLPYMKCEGCDRYKLHKGHQEDLKNLVKGIVKIVKQNSK